MTRIGIDIRWLHEGLTHAPQQQMLGGIGNYAYHLVPRLTKLHPDATFLLFCSNSRPLEALRTVIGSQENVFFVPAPSAKYARIADPVLGGILRLLQDALVIGPAVKRMRLDLFHSLSQFVPAYGSKGTRRLTTIHDIIPVVSARQSATRWLRIQHLRRIAQCDVIIADSDSTKRDIEHFLSVAPQKIVPIHLGLGAEYKPVTDVAKLAVVSSRHHIKAPYLLYVGGLQPNKNVSTLVDSFGKLRDRGHKDVTLVMIGASPLFYRRQYEALKRQLASLGLDSVVHLLPWLSTEELTALYSGATAFVYPSLYEGFGLPPLEAMGCGAPVITSRAASLPEIVGNAGVYIDPRDAEDIADGVSRVLTDSDLRRELRMNGLARAQLFSWDQTAAKHAAVYQQVLDKRSGGCP